MKYLLIQIDACPHKSRGVTGFTLLYIELYCSGHNGSNMYELYVKTLSISRGVRQQMKRTYQENRHQLRCTETRANQRVARLTH